MATMLTSGATETWVKSPRPCPPTPMLAMLSFSLGGVCPAPSTWRGTICQATAPAPATVAFFKNARRLILLMMLPFKLFQVDAGGSELAPRPHNASYNANRRCAQHFPDPAPAGRGKLMRRVDPRCVP